MFGPHGQIAIEGWTGPQASRRPGVLIYRHGDVTTLTTGVSAIPSLLAWGHRAPALAVAFPANRAELLFPDGRRQPLPHGWQPLAWNQAGTQLLMQSATGLGIWSATAPGAGAHGRHHHAPGADPPGGLAGQPGADVTVRPGWPG